METSLDINVIKPLISSELFKIIKDEIIKLMDKVLNENNISDINILENYDDDISKIGLKLGIKKRNRRSLPKEMQCMGRKLDGYQCTRSKRSGSDYCLSHIKRLPHGRIDDNSYNLKEKGKRGRKKKPFDITDGEYVATCMEILDNKKVLVDNNNNVYTYNIDDPKRLGKKVNNKIEYLIE
jgi:hypothetical protein